MLDQRGPLLPHRWVCGDDEMGRCSWFRQELQSRHERYLLAVPSNTSVRDLRAPDPPYPDHGRRPQVAGLRTEHRPGEHGAVLGVSPYDLFGNVALSHRKPSLQAI